MEEYVMYMIVLAGIGLVYLAYALWQKSRLKKFTNQSK
jgi:Flp pilus assembly protein TadB